MDKFEQQFETLDVRTGYMDAAMDSCVTLLQLHVFPVCLSGVFVSLPQNYGVNHASGVR
jgi:hypothetical protein